MSLTPAHLDRQIAEIYSDSIEEFRLPADTDMSHSDKCHTLTIDLYYALRDQGIRTKREFHMNAAGYWHYVVNHSPGNLSELDIITDLNPWQYETSSQHSGYLHGPRRDVQEILRKGGADEDFVALRGIATVMRRHHPDISIPQGNGIPRARIS